MSHKTIYKTLFIQNRGALKKSYSNILEAEELYKKLEPHNDDFQTKIQTDCSDNIF